MKRFSLCALALAVPMAAMSQTVFYDNFTGGSTLNVAPGAPTASTAGYVVASTKNATTTSVSPLTGGSLNFGLPSTTSGFVELQAMFASSAYALNNVGDSIQLNIQFVDTAGILNSGQTNSTLLVGLYNSGGTAPLSGLNASGLSAATTYQAGGAQLWQGYNAGITLSGIGAAGTGKIYTRAAQNNTGSANYNNGDQDLLFNGAGTGTYKDVAGVQIGSTTASAAALTVGSAYLLSYQITLSGAGTEDITYSLYDSGNNLLYGITQTASGSTYLTSSFDSFAVGYRFAGVAAGATSSMTLSSIQVNYNPVPEPSALILALGGLGILGLVRRIRR